MSDIAPVELLRRQYLQLQHPEHLKLPEAHLIRQPEIQRQIYDVLFNEELIAFPPPQRYQYRVLKLVVKAMENAVIDPEEDDISNEISAKLAEFMASSLPSETQAAQQKCHVTYTAPSPSPSSPRIVLLEAPSLLASSGCTGFRTWEASLHLATYLFLQSDKHPIMGKMALELGAGTGLISILCSKYLGASSMWVTDGSPDIVVDLKNNLKLNELGHRSDIECSTLIWGHTLIDRALDLRENGRMIDLVFGADVTYDAASIPALVATMRELFEFFPDVEILIAATLRNETTLNVFIEACDSNHFEVRLIDFELPDADGQLGFFHPISVPVHIYSITNPTTSSDTLT